LLAIGLWEMRHGPGWGAVVTATAACGFAEAGRIEKATMPPGGDLWLFSRRNAAVLAIPFALGAVWTAYLVGLLVYAAISFFIVQRVRHNLTS
jgi:hypothetical protein